MNRGVPLQAVLLLLLLLAAPARAVDIADTGKFVIDTAGVLDGPTRDKLEELLGQLERKTKAQVKVLTLPSTGDEDIVDFSQRTFRDWRLGQREKNNGALIVLAVNDRKVRVHTGYGLEGILPDSWIGTLSREIAARYFRGGQYSQGLYEMTLSVVTKVAQDAGVTIDNLPQPAVMPQQFQPLGMVCTLALVGFILFVVWLSIRNSRNQSRRNWRRGYSRNADWAYILGELLRGPPGGGGWKSSGGSGGFGGSFGGGGGSFGGGGSSGGGGGGASW